MTPLDLLQAHGPMVRNLIRMHVGTGPDADDAFQEVYLNLHRGWEGFRGASSPKTWLYRITLNTLLTHHRRGAIRKTQALDAHTAHHTTTPKPEQVDLLEKALQTLGPVERSMILMHLEGFDYGEIAEVFGIAAGTVGVRIHRIKKKITSWIQHPST